MGPSVAAFQARINSEDEYLCKLWTQTPDRFTLNPIHQMPGLNTWKLA
jgi:hypothetical protein